MLVRFLGFIGIICCVAIFSCQRRGMPSPESGVSYLLNLQRKAQFKEVSYDLSLTIPSTKSEAITGVIKVHFELLDAQMPVVLDFSQDSSMVRAVRSHEKNLVYKVENGHIVIPARQLKKGGNAVEISFVAGDLSLNRNEEYLYTLFVPDRASTCFPLLDQPNLKARYSLTLHTPIGWEAVSNGRLENKTETAQSSIFSFATTKPISSYLFAFTTGKFFKLSKSISGRDITMYYRETDSLKVDRNADSVFALHAQSLSWLENYTGIAYPFDKFDIALLPSFQYGGMEHPGAVFYNESALFLDENATINKRLARANVIAHESAHMWFGDLVTMDWFNDVWLKEVFANFMAAKIVHPAFPEMDHELRFLLAHYPAAYEVDRTLGANPIIQDLSNLKNAGTLYGSIIYHKAPIVMRQLEMKIGEKLMRQSLQDYLQKYKFDNARWDDLIGIIDGKTSLNMKEWSEVWVKSAGMPAYHKGSSGGEITYTQVPDQPGARIWQQPLQFGFIETDTLTRLDFNLVRGEEPRWSQAGQQKVFPNTNGIAYGYFPVDSITTSHFLSGYNQFDDPVFRGAMLVNIWEGFLRGDGASAEKQLKQLLQVLELEQNPLLIDYISGAVTSVWWKFLTESQREAQQEALESKLWGLMVKSQDLGIKNTYFKRYKALAYSPKAETTLAALWEGKLKIDGLTLSEDDKISLAYQLALLNPEKSDAILTSQMANVHNPDRKGKMNFVMPVFSDKVSVRDQFFESLKRAENREKESWVLEALNFLHHPLKQASAIRYLMPSMELLQEIQLTGDIFFPTRWMDHSFGGHSSKEALEIAQTFIDLHPDYPVFLRDKIYQATDLLNRSVKLQNKE